MQTERLVIMANQIGDFYKSFPDEVQSQKDIAEHLTKFWAKSMRDQIVTYIATDDGKGLQPIVKAAIESHLKAAA